MFGMYAFEYTLIRGSNCRLSVEISNDSVKSDLPSTALTLKQ